MQKVRVVFGSHRKWMLRAAVLTAAAVSIVFGMSVATPSKAHAQTQDTAAIKFEFDVATIKLNKSGEIGRSLIPVAAIPMSGMFRATNMPLIDLIREAYELGPGMGADDGRISGAPSWLGSERFDIQAKMDSSVLEALNKLGPDQRKLQAQHMLQALFAVRFKLTVHFENKELPIYSLVIAKNGPKFQESKPVDAAASGPQYQYGRGGRGGRGGVQMFGRGGPIKAQGILIADFVPLLSTILGRTVVDKTGLTGKYDFTLQWMPDETEASTFPAGVGQPPDPSGPSIFAAIQEQLGLKLESGKGPVAVIVIDHVERSSEN
jgi:uncharacterized protein (TIGR03435 family)